MIRRALAAALVLAASAGAADWQTVGTPAPGPVRVIGTHGLGCIAGAVALPTEGPGFQVIRASRSRFWGHPDTIAAIETLGRRLHAAGFPDIYIGDVGQVRGGPMPWGHASHQIGLDADIWFDLSPKPVRPVAAREIPDPPSLVRADRKSVDPARWTEAHLRLLRTAADLPGVDRIFVDPAIKRKLCETAGPDRAWLRRIRPWWGHAAHFHIRFRCPAGQPECQDQPPPPAGDGCDASLDWWFAQLDAPPKPRPPRPPRRPQLPAACAAVLAAP